MNFDKDFGSIYDRLTTANKLVKTKTVYRTNAQNQNFAHILETNYQAAFSIMVNANQGQFDSLFKSGIQFANTILENKQIIDGLKKDKLINELVFNKSQISLVELISEYGNKYGYKYVNIEYWPVLIFLYFAIKEIKQDYYSFPKDNYFISLIEAGNKTPYPIPASAKNNKFFAAQGNTLVNGFNNYYRMLFSTAIFSNGKAIEYNNLSNLNDLDISMVTDFLNTFKTIYTLNYDHILEHLVSREIIHLHGKYNIGKEEYLYFQSLGIRYDKEWISFSDILIGDYFVNKNFFHIMSTLNQNNDFINKKVPRISDEVDRGILGQKTNVLVIFGMNIDNDQHILRDSMLAFEKLRAEKTKFIYCFFNEEDKKSFQYWYDASITFREDVSEYVKSIELLFLDSKEVLKDYFGIMSN